MRSLIVAMLLFAPALVGQRTWTVHCNPGPGVDYTDIPPAVAAAAPGDTILVVSDPACTNWRFTAPLIDKPLKIIGTTPYAASIVLGLIEIRGIPAGSQVVLANIYVQMPSSPLTSPPPARGIWVHDCLGSVHLQNLSYSSNGSINGIAQFVDCAQVTMHSCRLYAPGSGSTAPSPPPECSVLFRRCNATVLDCEFYCDTPAVWYPIWQTAAPLYLEDSDVRLVACTAVGANDISTPAVMRPARSGVLQSGGTLTIGPATQVAGGYTNDPLFPVREGVSSANNGVVVRDPTAYLFGPNNGCLCPIQQTRTIPAVHLERPIHNRYYRLHVHGLAGSFAVVGVASSIHPGIPTPFGQLLLDPQWLAIVAAGQLNAQGVVEFNFFMHPSVPMDVLWAFQAGVIDTYGIAVLTLPAPFTVAWETGRTWP